MLCPQVIRCLFNLHDQENSVYSVCNKYNSDSWYDRDCLLFPPYIIPPTAVVTTSSSPPPTAVGTAIFPLTVRIVSSGDTLRAGQNHVLTCEASGGGSMAYTYTWLKDDSVVSGQTSSTYSFSPLLVVHSGQYSCRVSVGSMTQTSEGVGITVESESGYDHA